MLPERKYTAFTFCLVLIMLLSVTAWAQNMNAIKAQMLERKSTIDALKSKGVIGEGSDGYLHFRQDFKDAKRVVKAENNDRRVVYTDIGKNLGTTAAKVGQSRAIKLAELAAAGHWIKKRDGTWIRK